MLSIKVDLFPYGRASLAETIANGTISNINGRNIEYGDYNFDFISSTDTFQGEVHNFRRDEGALKLLYVVLKKHFEREK